MNKELPGYVLSKEFTNHFLFLDNEIIRNDNFRDKIITFSKNIEGKNIFIKGILPKEYQDLQIKKNVDLTVTGANDFDSFYEIEIVVGNDILSSILFDFRIYDNTNKWELYCSYSHEFCILGCVDALKTSVLNIINPYEELSLDSKLNVIEQILKHNKNKNIYLIKLLENYNFQEPSGTDM